MDKIADLRDGNEVVRALNATIEIINSKIHGIYDRRTVVTDGEAATGYTLSSTVLTLSSVLKELQGVWVSGYDNPWTPMPRTVVAANGTSTTYVDNGNGSILFAALPDDPTIYVEGLFCIDAVKYTDTTLSVPDSWKAGIMAGTLVDLLSGSRYENDKLFDRMNAMWMSFLDDIYMWSERRIPHWEGQEYNYQNPTGCIPSEPSAFQ
jgi:hypothetical protein